MFAQVRSHYRDVGDSPRHREAPLAGRVRRHPLRQRSEQNAAARPSSPARRPTSSTSTFPTRRGRRFRRGPRFTPRRTGYAGQLCGHPALRDSRDDDAGRMEQDDRHQPHRLLPDGALPLSAPQEAGQRLDRQLRLGPGAHEPEQRPRLCHVEGRDPCPHPGDGGRLRQGRDPRQLDLPGLDHVADARVSARSLTPEGGDWEETLAGFGRAHSAGRVGTIEEVAALVSYLVGPESASASAATFRSTAD